MALELEEKIMNEIGFGNHYTWYNGSGSCAGIREEACRRIARCIRTHHDKGDPIIAPDNKLVNLLKTISDAEESQYSLTKTWQAASDIIAAHIHAFAGGAERIQSVYKYYKKALPPTPIIHLHRNGFDMMIKKGVIEYDDEN